MSGTFEYLARRLEPQRKWHNEKATWNKRRFYTVEVITLLAPPFPSLIPTVVEAIEREKELYSSWRWRVC
jgi:hypothetical protein